MTDFFEYGSFFAVLIAASLWCWGVFTLFHEGYLLERVGNILRKEDDNSPPRMLGTWFTKPLFDCPPCMGSIHGFIFGVYAFGFSWTVPAFMICLCGLNFIVKSLLYPEYE